MMNNNKGFTLTEILLAAMIVGIIGVALAAITTAGVREGKVGRTKAVLRNQLSVALRQLRQDIAQSSNVSVEQEGRQLTLTQAYKLGPSEEDSQTITYQFILGNEDSGGGKIGGKLTRKINTNPAEEILYNVKSISGSDFISPSFQLLYNHSTNTYSEISSAVQVRIIVEVAGSPAINEVVDETFLLPQGIPIRKTQGV